jgi:hypothetical protein
MSSSDHILNSIWISVFPLLAVALILIVICYLICCLKRIKSKLKERNKFIRYMKTNENDVNKQQQYNKVESSLNLKQRKDEEEEEVVKVNEIYIPPPRSQTLTRKKFNSKTNSPYNHYNSNKKFKSMNEISYLEQLEVKELNESPKSLHKKCKSSLQEQQKQQQSTQTDLLDLNDKKQSNNKKYKRYGGSKTAPTTPITKKSNIKFKKQFIINSNTSSKSSLSISSNSILSSSSSSLVNKKSQNIIIKKLSNSNKKNSRIKLSLKRFSDIDNEDDVIFNDEDDSLSSTGLYFYNKNNNKLSQHNSVISNQSLTNAASVANNIKKESSKSSFEPDENILNDMLIKSNNKINELIEVRSD